MRNTKKKTEMDQYSQNLLPESNIHQNPEKGTQGGPCWKMEVNTMGTEKGNPHQIQTTPAEPS